VADGQVTIDAADADADSLQRILKRQKAKQVQSGDERQMIKGLPSHGSRSTGRSLLLFLARIRLKRSTRSTES